MKLLILGASSLIARGWADCLRERGHEVFEYRRGLERREGTAVWGPWRQLSENPHWPESMDLLVNFVLLRDGDIDENLAYCDHMLALCRRLNCKTLIHFSSVSVYPPQAEAITETTAPLLEYRDKPEYVGVKIATDQRLKDGAEGVRVVLVRPGLVLGPGIGNAIVGIAARLPGNLALVLGNPRQIIPLTSRSKVQDVLTALVEDTAEPPETVLVVDPNSPTRKEFLQACARDVGQARWVIALGAWFWYPAALLGEGLGRLLTRSSPRLYERVSQTFRPLRFDPSRSVARLGISLSVDWRQALQASYDMESLNYTTPAHTPRTETLASLERVLFLGFGPIVFQKHLPALKALGFKGQIEAFDPYRKEWPSTIERLQRVESAGASSATLVIVASPAHVHRAALDQLPETTRVVLLEKPVGLSRTEFEDWRRTEQERGLRVVVAHNYRYKRNVRRMLDYLARHHSGALRGCRIICDSPSAGAGGTKWRREERETRALLLDGNLHYFDLVSAFAQGPIPTLAPHGEQDFHGRTCTIEGVVPFSNFPLYYQVRVGPGPERTEVHFDFANYSIRLTFNPDTFTVLHGKTLLLHGLQETLADAGSLFRWAWNKARKRDYDDSHHAVYREVAAALAGGSDSPIELSELAFSYDLLFKIAEPVYGPATERTCQDF